MENSVESQRCVARDNFLSIFENNFSPFLIISAETQECRNSIGIVLVLKAADVWKYLTYS